MMAATRLEGRPLALRIREEVKQRAAVLRARGIAPKCVAIVVDGDGPGLLYAQTARRIGADAGVNIEIVPIGASADTSGALAIVLRIVDEPTVHGLIIQRPLPAKLDEQRIVEAIDPAKDVDGAHPYNQGLLALGKPQFVPSTASAVLEILSLPPTPPLRGARVAVVGRSAVVGRPAAALLTAADATVTVCHSRTKDLAAITFASDIVVLAVGKPGFLTGDMVAPGAIVVDVGTTVVDGRLVGDADPISVSAVAGALTPVPGGVGPITTSILLRNIVSAAEALNQS
ncbi:MAG TPA: bifunctional 5,10-methylenetetrahydrofolate dehydrogenase/5,10-methenyltetrahydrofolate cyclohydrolase [Candidatus Eremiobacteraceae bacterium]